LQRSEPLQGRKMFLSASRSSSLRMKMSHHRTVGRE
jgi:hypothetical protein